MDPPSILKFDDSRAAAEEYFLPAGKLLAGNPRQRLWQHYADATGRFSSGVWQSEVGKWTITYTEEEYCQLLEGVSVLTDSSGKAVRVSAGDSFVIPRGFTGTWEVLEPTRKIYVIYEAGT
jgi:uncharacterized protein